MGSFMPDWRLQIVGGFLFGSSYKDVQATKRIDLKGMSQVWTIEPEVAHLA